MELKNYMEMLVFDNVEAVIKNSGGCSCKRCRLDIAAMALNKLTPQYIVSTRGNVYSRLKSMEQQNYTDVITAIAYACACVKDNPRHDEEDD